MEDQPETEIETPILSKAPTQEETIETKEDELVIQNEESVLVEKTKKTVTFREPEIAEVHEPPTVSMKRVLTVLLMGEHEAGMTTFLNVGLGGMDPYERNVVRPTKYMDLHNLWIMNDYRIVVKDCSGDSQYHEQLLADDSLFRNVNVFLYVFDNHQFGFYGASMRRFLEIFDKLIHRSPKALIWIAVNKAEGYRRSFFDESTFLNVRKVILEEATGRGVFEGKKDHSFFQCEPTSVFEETVHIYWRRIFNMVVRNKLAIQKKLKECSKVLKPEMIMLFEKGTTYPLASYMRWSERSYKLHHKTVTSLIDRFRRNQGFSDLNCLDDKNNIYDPFEKKTFGLKIFIQNCTMNTALVSVFYSDNEISPYQLTWAGIHTARYFIEFDEMYERDCIANNCYVPAIRSRQLSKD